MTRFQRGLVTWALVVAGMAASVMIARADDAVAAAAPAAAVNPPAPWQPPPQTEFTVTLSPACTGLMEAVLQLAPVNIFQLGGCFAEFEGQVKKSRADWAAAHPESKKKE